MRSWICVLLAILLFLSLPAAFAQNPTIRSGFAVITVVSGNIAGLIAVETLVNRTSSGVAQAIVAPAALVTSASILVTIGPVAEQHC